MSKQTNTLALACLLALLPMIGNAQTCQADSIPATTPTLHDNSDGTVTDTKTNLMWKKCSEGQTGNDCSGGSAATYTWKAALEQAQAVNNGGGFAGRVDWRLPNNKELHSIVEGQCSSPAINLTLFPNTISWFWSSSPVASDANNAWIINFDDGHDTGAGKDYYARVRLVRGG